MILSPLNYQKAGDRKAFWKEAAFELDIAVGKGMIQTENRCIYEGGLGPEHVKVNTSGEAT